MIAWLIITRDFICVNFFCRIYFKVAGNSKTYILRHFTREKAVLTLKCSQFHMVLSIGKGKKKTASVMVSAMRDLVRLRHQTLRTQYKNKNILIDRNIFILSLIVIRNLSYKNPFYRLLKGRTRFFYCEVLVFDTEKPRRERKAITMSSWLTSGNYRTTRLKEKYIAMNSRWNELPAMV